MITVIVILAGMAFNPVVEICNTARNFGLIFAAASRVFVVLDKKEEVKDTGDNIEIEKLEKSIKFENVSFKYNSDSDTALNEVSFTAAPGETVALVGASGAGKTTCINLLLRYWDVNSGNIKIGDTDIRKMSIENLHDIISVVLQDVYLFNGTIKENICLGKKDATMDEIKAAAKTALAEDFIEELPEGYETRVGEKGMCLSGGQRQRIAIARAVLRKTSILVMDEALSNLDTQNEELIEKALNENCMNYTKLIIAHRISTIMSADKLIVLDKGRIVQVGNHEELINMKGTYRNLVKAQFKESLC